MTVGFCADLSALITWLEEKHRCSLYAWFVTYL
jgi:hypothetical protein